MNFKSRKHNLNRAFIVAVLAIFAVSAFLATIPSFATSAEPEFIRESEVVIAHISDLHYYSLAWAGNSQNKDYLKKQTGYHYMYAEVQPIVRQVFSEILEYASENRLDYLIASGDLSTNGEFQGHFEVANLLRGLQNDIRETTDNTNFQIIALIGNHDSYVPNALRFGGTDITNPNNLNSGISLNDDGDSGLGSDKFGELSVTKKLFARIYAGLGHPDYDEYIDNGASYSKEDFYTTFGSEIGRTPIMNDPRVPFVDYIESGNASHLTFARQGASNL
ncbi:MAG: metallophosphoesterase, partial [Firmicutes bacterium]|nr:metallophosphoesterase [Bacillota bacterium]